MRSVSWQDPPFRMWRFLMADRLDTAGAEVGVHVSPEE